MRTPLKVLSIIGIIIGGLALISLISEDSNNMSTLIASLYFIGWGIVGLSFLKETK
jgi:hypothetical protein